MTPPNSKAAGKCRSTLQTVAVRLSLIAFGLLAAALLVEAAARVYFGLHDPGGHVNRWEFRATRPHPYKHSDYFCPEFLRESMAAEAGHQFLPGESYVVPAESSGKFINVCHQKRRTTDQPAPAANRLLLFGGSTLFSAEVPDNLTIASCLQRFLNHRNVRLRVENYGACSMSAKQQSARLLDTKLNPGDVVVFYDGVNDVFYPIYNCNPSGWQPGEDHHGGARKLNHLQRWLYPACFAWKEHSAAAKFLFLRMQSQSPANVGDLDRFEDNLENAGKGFGEALTQARQYAESKGARFLHFLQPHLFTHEQHSSYERRVIRNELKLLPGLDQAFTLGYPKLQKTLDALKERGLHSTDLSGVLDLPKVKQEVYLDFCHVTEAANQQIAEAIGRGVVDCAASSTRP